MCVCPSARQHSIEEVDANIFDLRDAREEGAKPACKQRVVTEYLNPLTSSLWDNDPHNVSHQNCRHSAIDAVKRRHYKKDLPRPSQLGRQELERAFCWLKRECRKLGLFPGNVTPWTPEEVVETRAPAKKATYQRAFDSLLVHPVNKKDSYVQAFIKHEKGPAYQNNHDPTQHKPSRLIQHRHERYCARLAQFLGPVEHALYQLRWHGTAIFGKSLNQYQTADEIVGANQPGTRYFMLDHSSFDAHVSGHLLELEHRLYLWLYKNDRDLMQLLDWQKTNRVHLVGGLRFDTMDIQKLLRKWVYTRRGVEIIRPKCPPRTRAIIQRYFANPEDAEFTWPGRMSGDFNTGLGNSIINCLVLYAFAYRNGLHRDPRYRFCVNGDDCWGTIPLSFKMPDYTQFQDWGMTTKLEGEAYYPEGVKYCQAAPVRTSEGWMMVRDYRRVLNRLPYTIRRYTGKAWDEYARGVADCEIALGLGIPILDSIARSLDDQFADVRRRIIDRGDEYGYAMAMKAKRNRVMTEEVRTSYALAYDISPDDQIAIERMILKHQWRIPSAVRDGPKSIS